jgi:hypothetical protein
MTVGYVKDFKFPSSGVHVRGHVRAAKGHAAGGIVSAPKAGMRKPRPGNAVGAERMAEGMAMKPARGPRISAKISVAKPPSVKAPKAPAPVGALQSATSPMITPPPAPMPGGMAKGGRLTAASRNALPKSSFAGPDRSYPVPDASHAANAKARATQAVNAGRMSSSTKAKIDAKANKVLGR